MNIQEMVVQVQADRNLFETVWQSLGISEAEANRRINILDHTIESLTKLVEVIGDTDKLGILTVIVDEKS